MSVLQDEALSEPTQALGRRCAKLLKEYQLQSTVLFQVIATAVFEGDREQLRLGAGRLKGLSGYLGAVRVNLCCDRLEQAAVQGSQKQLEALLHELAEVQTVASKDLAMRLSTNEK